MIRTMPVREGDRGRLLDTNFPQIVFLGILFPYHHINNPPAILGDFKNCLQFD
jgi:hypothetical protein